MPRDPQRIYRICTKLCALWAEQPDIRLGQLVDNLTTPQIPLFYLEDQAFEELIDNERKKRGTNESQRSNPEPS